MWNKYNVETKTKLNTLTLELLANKKKHIFGLAFWTSTYLFELTFVASATTSHIKVGKYAADIQISVFI